MPPDEIPGPNVTSPPQHPEAESRDARATPFGQVGVDRAIAETVAGGGAGGIGGAASDGDGATGTLAPAVPDRGGVAAGGVTRAPAACGGAVGAGEVGRRDLTTQEVADALKVSRPHVVKLIDTGKLPGYLAGAHRRVRHADLLVYRDAQKASRRAALNHLVAEAQAMGAYDAPAASINVELLAALKPFAAIDLNSLGANDKFAIVRVDPWDTADFTGADIEAARLAIARAEGERGE